MAATFNAFTALVGSQDALAASAKKKKKSNASKKPAAAEPAQPSKAPVSEPAPVVTDGPAVVPVNEAVAIAEKTARTYKSGADRVKLWKDWMKQVRDRNMLLPVARPSARAAADRRPAPLPRRPPTGTPRRSSTRRPTAR